MASNLSCPRCSFHLREQIVKGQVVDHCFRCGGTFLERGVEQKILGASSSPSYWQGTEIAERKESKAVYCPKDQQRLLTYAVGFQDAKVEVDLCPECDGIWLDPMEGKKLVNVVLAEGQKKEATFNEKPGFKSYLFQAFSGMPVEAWNPVHHRPVITMSLMGLLVFIFCLQIFSPNLIQVFALYPEKLLRGEQIWGLLTAGFLHGGLAHLLGNLYFLYIFGDNVEDHLGRHRYVWIYLAAIICSSLAFVIARWDSNAAMIGASGAISALVGAYIVIFPRIKLYFTLFFIPVRLGVTWYFAFWLIFNFVMMIAGGAGVAWSAHIGGFVFGLGAGYVLKFQSIIDSIGTDSSH